MATMVHIQVTREMKKSESEIQGHPWLYEI